MQANLSTALQNTVPIGAFNKGYAGKVFDEVRKTGPKIVLKNNAPAGVVLSPEDYTELMELLEDAKLALLAYSRLEGADPNSYLSHEQILKEFGITKEDLDAIDEVELE